MSEGALFLPEARRDYVPARGSAHLPWAPGCAGARSLKDEHGFESSRRSVEHGFTLIEMLVAVMIFAMLATAGVVLLRGAVTGQAAIGRHLDALADVQRGVATLDADLSQAAVRISRTQTGSFAPAFFGRAAQGGEPLMQFVRDGWSNPGTLRRASLQKIEYWWREGRIERIGYPAVDGAAPPEPAVLFDGVSALTLRYRDRQGNWRERWSPETPAQMPTAVEMVLTRGSDAPLTLRFLVGTAINQPEIEDAAPASGGLGNAS